MASRTPCSLCLVNVTLTAFKLFSGHGIRCALGSDDRPMSPDAFPEIAPLIAAAKADGIDARAVLARVLTDLFVGRKLHTGAELEQFEALVDPLIRAVATQTAVALARKLT